MSDIIVVIDCVASDRTDLPFRVGDISVFGSERRGRSNHYRNTVYLLRLLLSAVVTVEECAWSLPDGRDLSAN